MKLQELKKQYEFSCNEYAKKFANKQQIEFNGWVDNDIGGLASFSNGYFFYILEIFFDIHLNLPKGVTLQSKNKGVYHFLFTDKN